jgi:hypothetical protein
MAAFDPNDPDVSGRRTPPVASGAGSTFGTSGAASEGTSGAASGSGPAFGASGSASAPGPVSRTIPELLTDLVRDLGELFRKEGRLVRAEISEAVGRLTTGIEMLGAGAVLLLVALFVLVQALVIALAELVGAGWSSLIVGGLLAAIGIFLILRGRKDLSASSLMPERAIEQTSRDVRLAKEQI